MNITKILLTTTMLLAFGTSQAKVDHKDDPKYKVLRDSMTHAFNDGDSARFYTHLTNLQNYLLEKDDLHGTCWTRTTCTDTTRSDATT